MNEPKAEAGSNKSRPKPEGPHCPGCGAVMPPGRGVCPECGYMTGWFRVRMNVGCAALLIGFLGILAMIYLMLNPPPMPPQ